MNMAGKGVRLKDLQEAHLQYKLEEWDLDTAGMKGTLQNRLQQELREDGSDQDIFLFETSDL